MKKKILLVLLVMAAVSGCSYPMKESKEAEQTQEQAKEEEQTENREAAQEAAATMTYSTWVAYWDYETAFEEIDACGDAFEKIVAFEALYTGDNEIWLPQETEDILEVMKNSYQGNKEIYLSFVNDYRKEDGTYSQKDVTLLEAALESEESRNAHTDKIIETAQAFGTDGVELDYENLKRANQVEENYVDFISMLYEKCQAAGLGLRVDVEQDVLDRTQLPAGPEYVIMCYNLYGYGTEAGPKADKEFLETICEKCEGLEHVTLAFSVGGFDWTGAEVSKALTETEAEELRQEKGITELQRDEASRCAYFTYEENGIQHEVWYADAETLNFWKRIAVENGYYDIAVWRMNGNNTETLKAVTS